MRLKEFSAQNYRSITTAYNLPLSEYTVLVGPNNEGKSNILRALGLGLKLLSRGRAVATTRRSRMRLRYREMERFDYDWIRDFPVSLQASKPDSGTSLYFTFKLTKADFQDFRTRVESNLQTDLKVKLDLGQEDAVFDVMIQGKAKKYLKTKAPQIAEFIGSKILVQYIPATRTSEMAHAVVNELLEAELASIEKSESYKKSIRELDELQRPVRERVSKQIAQTMGNFIPNLKSVSLAPDQCSLQRALRASVQVMIDDGA
ncbi:MAG: ATP-binding protein, partial [candidate division Zixibacteria bacterium]|nr:ATP-binding protein [candidate division Zixibacteria bacterium]